VPPDAGATTHLDDPGAAATIPDGGAAALHGRAIDPAQALPSVVGRFEILGKLGEGGMGVVYEARDPRLDRRLAVKLVRTGASSQGRARLVREAQAMARVTHPNVVTVYEAGLFDDEVFIAMELVAGGATLGAWLAASPRGWRETLAMLIGAGRGVVAVHDAGLVHRDFKLDNVLVGGDGRPRVLDFGLARGDRAGAAVGERHDAATDRGPGGARAVDLHLTRPGSLLGTPSYMSPEQLRGEEVGVASDQFSFCVAAYRALFQRAPFEGDDLAALREAVLTGRLEPVPSSDVPREVADAIARGLAVDPADRWPDLAGLVDSLQAALDKDPDADPHVGRAARRLIPGILVVVATVSFAVMGALGMLTTLDTRRVFFQGLIGASAVVVVSLVGRKQLAKSRTNRRVAALFLTLVGGVVLHRALALAMGTPAYQVLASDCVIAAVVFTLAALIVERWFAWSAAVSAAAAIVSARGLTSAMIAFPVALLTIAAVPVFFWRPARGPARAGGGGVISSSGSRSRSRSPG
jgi:serine/threonine-protein kinase